MPLVWVRAEAAVEVEQRVAAAVARNRMPAWMGGVLGHAGFGPRTATPGGRARPRGRDPSSSSPAPPVPWLRHVYAGGGASGRVRRVRTGAVGRTRTYGVPAHRRCSPGRGPRTGRARPRRAALDERGPRG